jgi:hypothetical protein
MPYEQTIPKVKEQKFTTIKEYLIDLSNRNTSSEKDDIMMQNLLRTSGLYPDAKVTMGVVYLEGRGTINNPPMSIQQTAKLLLLLEKKI